MITDAFIFNVLDLSTSHMTKADNDRLHLSTRTDSLPGYELGGYGWLIYVGELEDNWSVMSSPFKAILKEAQNLQCDYVRFDRDGRIHDELPVFDW